MYVSVTPWNATFVERPERDVVVIAQGEVEDIDVLLDPPGVRRADDQGEPTLEVPAKHHLGR